MLDFFRRLEPSSRRFTFFTAHKEYTLLGYLLDFCVAGDQPAYRSDLGGEEIRGEQRAPMGAQERPPRHRPLTARWNALFVQDPRDCRAGDPMAEVLERALDPRVAPERKM